VKCGLRSVRYRDRVCAAAKSFQASAECSLGLTRCYKSDLGLAAPGGTAIRCSAGRSTCSSTVGRAGGREASAGFTDSGDFLILHLNQRAGSPAAALGHRLLVCSEVEPDKEEQV